MVVSHPPFFVTLVAGLLIAFALQLLLTNFGIAAGITALGYLPQVESGDHEPLATNPDRASRPIGMALGMGTLLSVNLALFAAGFLAVKLSMTVDWMVGAVLGVVIWSAYFLILVWLGTTTVGVMFGTAVKVINSGWRGLRAIATTTFQPSHQTEAKQYESLYRQLSQELNQTLNQTISETLSAGSGREKADGQANQERVLATDMPKDDHHANDHQGDFKSQADHRVGDQKQDAIAPVKQLQDGIKKTIAITQKMLASEDTIKHSLKSYVLDASAKQLTRKSITPKVKAILQPADVANATVKQQLSQLQRQDFATWLQQRDDLSPKKIEKIVNRLELARLEVLNAIGDDGDDQPSPMNWETVQSQLQEALEQPQAIAPALLPLLSQIDWYRVMEQIQTNDNLSPEQMRLVMLPAQQLIDRMTKLPLDVVTNQAEQLRDRLDSLSTTLVAQTAQMQRLAQQQVAELQQQAKHQVETARKTATIAAWWLFATASTSLVTTAIAGVLASHH